MPAPTASQVHPALGDLLDGMSKISGHRQVLMRLNAALADEQCDAQMLTDILRLDPGLSARVISAANSIYFRKGMPVASVEEAVIRVGLAEIRRLLIESIAFELTIGPLRSYSLGAGELWHRSLACALAMDVLASEARRSADICHTIGLMHALGMVVIDRWMTRQGATAGSYLGDAFDANLADREREAVGYTNAEVCGCLLDAWHFPESIVTVVRLQDAPEQAGRFDKLACLLCLARWQMQAVLAGRDVSRVPPIPDADRLSTAGIRPERLVALVSGVKDQLAELKARLGVI